MASFISAASEAMELPLIIRVFSEYNVRSSFELLAALAVIPFYENAPETVTGKKDGRPRGLPSSTVDKGYLQRGLETHGGL
jgi:hypothetical protein